MYLLTKTRGLQFLLELWGIALLPLNLVNNTVRKRTPLPQQNPEQIEVQKNLQNI